MTITIITYLLTDSFAGFAAGLLGVGGGLIIVPVLYHIFTIQNITPAQVMHMALATSLATITVTSIASTLAHHKQRAVHWHLFLILLPGILIGAWTGGLIASRLDSNSLKPTFAVFELAAAIIMLRNFKIHQHIKETTIKTLLDFS